MTLIYVRVYFERSSDLEEPVLPLRRVLSPPWATMSAPLTHLLPILALTRFGMPGTPRSTPPSPYSLFFFSPSFSFPDSAAPRFLYIAPLCAPKHISQRILLLQPRVPWVVFHAPKSEALLVAVPDHDTLEEVSPYLRGIGSPIASIRDKYFSNFCPFPTSRPASTFAP